MNINKVLIAGRITLNPELKALPSGSKVCSFGVATNETYKDAQGVKKEKTEFHNIVIFGKLAETVAQYMTKGSEIFIEGKIQNRSWDAQDGTKKYRTEIIAQSVQFGAKPKDAQAKSATPSYNEMKDDKSFEERVDDLSATDYAQDEDINLEDIPF